MNFGNGMCLALFMVIQLSQCENTPDSDKWKKKDVKDYTDADIERLYDQWEEADDEELPEDELPEWKRPQKPIDLSKIDPNNPEETIKESKRGRTLMLFSTVSGDPTEDETQTISQIWQQSLFNANIEVQRYVVGKDRVLFLLKDGSKAFEIKNFLVSQERCEVVTIEGRDYFGKGSSQYQDPNVLDKDKTKKKKKEKSDEDKKNSKDKSKKSSGKSSHKSHKRDEF